MDYIFNHDWRKKIGKVKNRKSDGYRLKIMGTIGSFNPYKSETSIQDEVYGQDT